MTVESAKHYRALAAQYRAFGFNLVPLGSDKRPAMTGVAPHGGLMRFRWEDWQQTRQSDDLWTQIKKHEWWKDVGGLAAVCGPVSGDLVCIDFDTPKESVGLTFPYAIVEDVCQRLGVDDGWTVDSPRGGFHVWVRCPGLQIEKGKLDRAPANLPAGLPAGYHIELRWVGHYAALPESQHPNGVYRWHGSRPDSGPPVVDAAALLAAYDAVTVPPAQQTVPQIHPLPTNGYTNGNGYNGNGHNGNGNGVGHRTSDGSRWARAAFDAEIAALRMVTSNRNDALNKATFALGSIVAGGYLDEGEVCAALESAGLDIGLGAGEVAATIASGMRSGAKSPRSPSVMVVEGGEYYEYGFVAETPEPDIFEDADQERQSDDEQQAARHRTWPYSVKDGRMVLLHETSDGDTTSYPIADFTATIAEEIADENGNVHLVIAGHGLRRGTFRCEISGQDFGSESRLLALLTATTGGIDVVYNGMHKHLRPAIGKLTAEGGRTQRVRYYRTGWQDDSYLSFLMPGMDDTTLISVPRQIAYAAPDPQADMVTGLSALVSLVEAMDAKLTAPIIAALFMPPMLRPAGLGNERVAVFIAGRTGSLKTSWTQTAMCLYGPGFASNDNLLKLGEGATRNAIMAFASHANDLPMMVDNYKPNTGNGKHDLVNLIHNILEGGDRKRSERSGALRDSKLIRCIPIVTGEDLPRDDAASLARILLVTFAWQRGEANDNLTAAQENSEHLCAVGWSWIQWLQSPEGHAAAKAAGKAFPRLRAEWAAYLSKIDPNSANIARIASNLAVNQLAWQMALQHPAIGPVLAPYTHAHMEGLRAIARTMAKSTVEALEAHQYRNALRELLGSNQYKVIDRAAGKPTDSDRDRVLGWKDSSGVYLLPAVALAAIKKLLGPTQFLISAQTLYGQMAQLGWLADKGKGSTTKVISMDKEKIRVLHVLPSFLDEDDGDGTGDAGGDEDDGDSIDPAAELGL